MRSFARSSSGYTLVALVILVTVMNVVVATALPLWSKVVQRQKEEELIFRGLQYAEAIRVFQVRHQRLPVRLEELLEMEPRSIRQLWRDPFNEEGGWALILGTEGAGGRRVAGGSGAQGQGRRRGGLDPEDDGPAVGLVDPTRPGRGRRGRSVTGPIMGVYSLAKGEAVKVFNGASTYKEWKFTADLLPVSPGPVGGENVPRLSSKWVGRPFPEGVEPQEGGLPEGDLRDADDDEDEERGRDSRRPQRRRRGGRSDG